MSLRIDGKKLAQQLQQDIAKKVKETDQEIILDIIYVGTDPVIDNFIKFKKQFGESVGVQVQVHNFSETINQEDLILNIKKIQEVSKALIVQLPLPEHINTPQVLNSVHVACDVDVLSDVARQAFIEQENYFYPAVVGSIAYIVDSYNIDLSQHTTAIIGEGFLVGQPLSLWFSKYQYPYSIIQKDTDVFERARILKNAEIIISGVGIPGLIQASDIKEGVMLFDAGTSESGKKIVGDIDIACYAKSSLYTPVPGGIGPLTIAILYANVLRAHDRTL